MIITDTKVAMFRSAENGSQRPENSDTIKTNSTSSNDKPKNIAIVGGGLSGMVLAYKYAKDGDKVTVFEAAEREGGLATWSDIASTEWDSFYHVILPSDRNLIGLIRELGLEDDLIWQRTYTGFFVNDKMYSISSNLEFLKFPLLGLWSKARLGWTMFYGSRINDWKRLESITCKDWLTRVSGKDTYEKMWKPLLLAKLGKSHERTSAVFIWSYIKRMFSARDKSASSEKLGHVSGGYKQIFSTLRQHVENNGGEIRLSTQVEKIEAIDSANSDSTNDDQQLRLTSRSISNSSNSSSDMFDEIVCTSPTPIARKIIDDDLLDYKPARIDTADASKTAGTQEIEYLGVVCGVLVTHKPLSNFYVINIADQSIHFTGAIGMSNVVPAQYTDNLHLTYLPRYLLSTDEEMQQSDEYFQEHFYKGLTKMFPEFEPADAIALEIKRAQRVQPLQVLGYSSMVPSIKTKHPNLYVLNTSQFVNSTLNNNEVVGSVSQFYSKYSNVHTG